MGDAGLAATREFAASGTLPRAENTSRASMLRHVLLSPSL